MQPNLGRIGLHVTPDMELYVQFKDCPPIVIQLTERGARELIIALNDAIAHQQVYGGLKQ